MALNKYATIRYRVIDRCLRSRNKPFPSKEYLRQACEEELYGSHSGEHISISTIEKDLWSLKNESSLGYAPIAYHKANNGYYYTDDQFSLDLPLNEDDIELIRLATNTLKQFKESRIFQDLESSISKIEGRLKVYPQMDKADQREMIRFETAPAFIGSEYLSFLLDAIKNQQELKLSYIPYIDQKTRNYIVHPYFLQEHKNRWYLICYETNSKVFRTLGLDRMVEPVATGKSFIFREEFNPDDYYKYSFGIGIYSGVPQEVILSFKPIQGKYLTSQPIHSTQAVLIDSDVEFRISLKLIISPEFVMHILSYGPDVVVISPDHLKLDVKTRLREAVKRY